MKSPAQIGYHGRGTCLAIQPLRGPGTMDAKPLFLAVSALVATALASSPGRAEVTSPLLAGLRLSEPSPFRYPAAERKMDFLQPNPALLGEGYLTMLSSPNRDVVVPSRVDGDTDL